MKAPFVSRLGAALLGAGLLCFASGAGAKEARAPLRVAAAPQVTIINGVPLQIHVGDDSSFEVFNSQVPGSGQIFPSGATGTADMGWFVRTADNTLYSPNFGEHPAGSATSSLGAYTPFTPVSLSGVSGAGTTASPFRVSVSSTLGASGISENLEVSYVNGENYFTKTLTLSNSGAAQSVKVFLGADIFLAASDSGVPFREPNSGSPGGQDCGSPPTYTILLIPQSAPDAYTGRSYSTVWGEIGAGQLDNITDPGCEDNGAAMQWNRTLAAGGTTVVQAATSFGDIPTITQFNVSGVNPNNGAVGTSVNVTITGVGFLPGTTFDFGAGITVTQLVIGGANTATATLVISAGATLGPRDVTGTQGGAGSLTSTLANGFTVTNGGGVEPSAGPIAAPAMSTLGLLMLVMTLAVAGAFAWRRV